MASWIDSEIKAVDFGDLRLNKRFGNVLEALFSRPMESIASACKVWGDTKAAYRFFDNENVNEDEILNAHRESTIGRMRNEAVVLLVQDSSEIDYTSKTQTTGLGPMGQYEKRQGFYLHPTLAVTPERLCLGTVHTKMWARDPTTFGKRADRAKKPITEKESMRWLESLRETEKIAQELPDTLLVNMSDREGDIYEMFVETQAERANKLDNVHFIIRGSQDRLIRQDKKKRSVIKQPDLIEEQNIAEQPDSSEKKEINEKIWSTVENTIPIGTIEFDMPAGRGREARHVKQIVYAAEVKLKAPKRVGQPKLPDVKINTVLTKEIDCPEGAEPVEWLLLTSLPISSIKEVLCVIEWYLCRWQIEIFFKILKSGCQIEKLQLASIDRLKVCVSVYMIVAWRLFFTTMLGRACPDLPCTTIFDESEWKAVYTVIYKKSPPKEPPPLNIMIRLVASLGGFLNRKGDGFPGVKTMWIGIQRMRDFALAWEIFRSNPGETYG